jgi:polyphenol oxidase
VLTADCAPILFADPGAKVIACAHAGWRGALDGIVASTIAAMLTQGARREHIRATLGPCIGPAAYEVGPEFKSTFVARDRSHQQYFSIPDKSGREHFDLPAFVLAQLKAEQLGGIENQSRCTYANTDDFFSYRRATHLGETDYGRQISAIVVT